MNAFRFLVAAALVFLAAQRLSLGGSATWSNNPSSGDWNTAANWVPATVPNSESDVATFGASNVTDVINTNAIVDLDSLVFNPGASQYTISASDNIALYGTGIVNNSGTTQSFVAGAFFFNNLSTAGSMTDFSNVGGLIVFYDSSSAGSATMNLSDNVSQACVSFFDSSTAASATMNVSGGAFISLGDNATGGNATFTVNGESFLGFVDDAVADHAQATCIGGDQYYGASILFQGFGSAGEGTFTAVGASSSGEKGSHIEFDGSATADHATFVIGGGLGAGLAATTLSFYNTSTAAAARITATGGMGGAKGGAIVFRDASQGGTARIALQGNGELDIRKHEASSVTIGSLSGKGQVFLGSGSLAVGNNNRSTRFSGVIQDGGRGQQTGGNVSKVGKGALTLEGASTYTGGTTVSAGDLIVENEIGSGAGSGSVQVNAGTLAGQGAISGPVTIGTGSGSGAFLAPSAASKQPVALSLTSALTFNADATYTCALQASKKKSANDDVVADGVTIASGAQFNLVAKVQGKLKAGTVFTIVSNTASTPISGTFVNLADGAILTAGNTKLQASYEGGDGNDLTLTVVP